MSPTKKIGRIVKYTAFGVLFSFLLSGCTIIPKKKSAEDPASKQIVVWSFEDEDAWKPVEKKFESEYEGYALVYEKQTFDADYENRVMNSVLSTQKPDIWAMPNDWVYRHKEKLQPMPTALAKTVSLDSQFVPAVKQSVYFNNQIYALSPSAEPLMVYYNPAIFDSAKEEIKEEYGDDPETKAQYSNLLKTIPANWTDFIELANLLTETDGDDIERAGVALGTSNVTLAPDILYLLMMQNETPVVASEMNLATFNLPAATARGGNDYPGRRALEFYTSFADPGSDNHTWNDSLGSEIEAFANGKAAMIFGYSGLANYFDQKYPDLKYKKAFVPQVEQDAEKIVDYTRFQAFGVNRLSKAPNTSWGAVKILVDDAAKSFNSATRLYTAAKAKSYDISIDERKGNNPEKLSLATAKSLVKGRYPGNFDDAFRLAINAVNNDTQEPQAALDLAANTITESLRKTGW
ncbi:MAG: extracellular solute-binding protein [Patescibacteria group bacterium]